MSEADAFETRCVHAGEAEALRTTPVAPPLYITSVFETPTLDAADAAMEDAPGHYVYSRVRNPTVAAFEAAIASLEGAEAALAAGSGMGAIGTVLLGLLSPGDHVVASSDLYGSTTALLTGPLARLGVRVDTADAADPATFAAATDERTRLFMVETVSNPLMRVADIPGLAEVARRAGALLVTDASFTSPALSQPLAQGADLVVHSATKYIGGHSDVTAGVVAGRAGLVEPLRETRKLFGPVCSPLDAWLAMRGLKTLALRMERHTANAQRVAGYLCTHPRVRGVYYSGLPDDPHHDLARRVLPRGAGGMLAFEIDGGRAAVDRMLAAFRMVRFAASLADVSTTVSHPALTSHRGLSDEARAQAGIGDGLVRLSAGIESPDDICADLERGLAAI
jgi:cystathionine beta-lyase/cystathionine gamma-synthase